MQHTGQPKYDHNPCCFAYMGRWAMGIAGIAMLVGTSVCAAQVGESADSDRIVSVQRIWDKAPHNAFTDLVRHRDEFFCVFREGDAHVSPDGALRVIVSADGRTWESAARITSAEADLRDAKITVAPDGRLMLCGAGAYHDTARAKHQTYVWYSEDGRQWSDAIAVGEPDYWLWRITWNGDTAYGVGYSTRGDQQTRLYRSMDGKRFDAIVKPLLEGGYPNESSLLFPTTERAYCLTRRDGGDFAAQWGTSTAPFTTWTWKSLGLRIGGPQVIQLPDGRIVAGGRDYVGGATTKLWWLDPELATLTEIVTLPSGGDTSYPGMVYHDGALWVSYYSSHEQKTSIYLARVELPAAE